MNTAAKDVLVQDLVPEVCLRISVSKLFELFASGSLHAEDLRCLDMRSKRTVKQLLLQTCLDIPPKRKTPLGIE
jgi:hypothetical protein